MEYVILGLLLLMPNTLYGIRKAFEQGISMFYSSSLGSLQTAVKRLEEKGHITSEDALENGRAKKVLTVTEAGAAAFFNWLNAPLEPNNLEVSFLSRLYFVGLIPEKPAQLERLLRMKQDISDSHQLLEQANIDLSQIEIPEVYQQIFFFQRKVLQYGIDTHAYGMAWLENLIAELGGTL